MNVHSTGTCSACGKQAYRSRAAARAAKKALHPREKMGVYQCGSYFHMGHDEVWRWRPPSPWSPLPIPACIQINAMANRSMAQPEGSVE